MGVVRESRKFSGHPWAHCAVIFAIAQLSSVTSQRTNNVPETYSISQDQTQGRPLSTGGPVQLTSAPLPPTLCTPIFPFHFPVPSSLPPRRKAPPLITARGSGLGKRCQWGPGQSPGRNRILLHCIIVCSQNASDYSINICICAII